MAEFIAGRSANDVWKRAADMLLRQKITLKGRAGDVYELLHSFITIEEPRQKWVYDRIPPMSIGFALAELVWIMNGEDASGVINAWNPKLKQFAGNGEFYYGAYGKRIRSHFGFDQLEKAYNALQYVPESRQVVIQIYDTKKDFPMDNGKPRDSDIPCNICALLKVRDGKLEWSQIMRSNDILLGMPYNFIQFTGLQEILAGWLEIEVGSYNHYSDSLHLYDRDINKMKIGQEPEMHNSDSLGLKKEESERIFKELYHRMNALTKEGITEKEINALAQCDCEFEAYNNIMYVIAAYMANKRKYHELTKDLIQKCTNTTYVTMWNQWINRV